MHRLAIVGNQKTWHSSRVKQHLCGISGAYVVRGVVSRFFSQWYQLAQARSGTPQRSHQLHTALQTCTVQFVSQNMFHVSAKQVMFVPQRVGAPIHGTCEQHTDCTGRVKAHTAAKLQPDLVQLRHRQHSSSSSDSMHQKRCPDTSAWVAQVLSPEFTDVASRGLVTNLFQKLTKMLHLISSPASRRGRGQAALQRYRQLLVSMHVKLPQAIAVLANRAAYLATAEIVPSGERLHAPITLLLYSSALHAAPPALRKQVMLDQGVTSAKRSLECILLRCTQQRTFCSKSKFVSMTCKSLILLHDCGVGGDEVRKAQAELIGRVRTASMQQFDTAATADLCSLMAAFRAAHDQRTPRAWYIAMARLQELACEGPVHFPTAGRIAGSIVKMQHTLLPGLRTALIDAGSLTVKTRSFQGIKPDEVANYLIATAQLQLPVPKDVVKGLLMWAVARQWDCQLPMIVSMLAAVQKLQVQLSQEKDWRQIRMHVRGASLDDLESFCLAAQELDVTIHQTVAVEIARAASRAAAEEGTDDQVAVVRKAVRLLVCFLFSLVCHRGVIGRLIFYEMFVGKKA